MSGWKGVRAKVRLEIVRNEKYCSCQTSNETAVCTLIARSARGTTSRRAYLALAEEL